MSNFHDFKLQALGGGDLALSSFKNKVVLVVNVASKCGLTPQYQALESLQLEYANKGFTVLGIPCNQFMGQEPGSDEEIQAFCTSKFNVTFPLSGKVDVNGDTRDALYQFLTDGDAAFPGDIQWNFEKFLIGKNGQVLGRFSPKTEPNADELVKAITEAL